MTISDTATKFRYEGNGVTDTFAFSGKAFTAADLVVEIITRATDALEETLTITTHYSVTIADDGTASIVTVAGKIPSATQDIQIRRSLAQTQSVVLPTGTKFPAKSVENAIDRAVGLSQDLEESVTRSLKFPATSSTTTALLPEPTDDATIAFDGTTGTFKVGPTTSAITSAATNAAAAAASAAAASTSETNAAASASAAAASAAGVNLPSVSGGDATKLLKVNSGGTGFELTSKLPNHTASKRGALLVQNDEDNGFEFITSQGTSGQALISNGSDALPSFQTLASGWITIRNVTLANDASVEFEDGVSGVDFTAYDEYRIVVKNFIPGTDDRNLQISFSVDGGSTSVTCAFHAQRSTSGANTYTGTNSASTAVPNILGAQGTGTGENGHSIIELGDINSSAYKLVLARGLSYSAGAVMQTDMSYIVVPTTSAINSITFSCNSSATLASGNIILQGRSF